MVSASHETRSSVAQIALAFISSFRVIAEGIVDKPADLDVATVMSMGFPATKGGLIFWADLVGAAYIVKRLEQFAAQVSALCLE